MSERDELADILMSDAVMYAEGNGRNYALSEADAILAAGYRKPRTITTAAELEALPLGSAVQTSDDADTVVLRSEGRGFRNQSGYELSVEVLWRYGTRPFIVIYEPEPQP